MELQFHPASGSGTVRRIVLSRRAEKPAILCVGAAALAAVSLWFTVPAVATRALREEPSAGLRADSADARSAFATAETRSAAMAERARDAAGRLARIAFLYGVSPRLWPRTLNPEAGVLSGSAEKVVTAGLPRFLPALDDGLSVLLDREAADPRLAARTPSILPLLSELFEPASVFGPRTSPWTNAEEFFPALAVAAPAGSGVIAPAEGLVVFAGRVKPKAGSRFWRYGNIVVLFHGDAHATVFGHLGRIEVRRGQTLRRGDRIGTVGTSGWVVSPSLHYELWCKRDGRLAPTDPRFAVLDRRLGPPDVSLEKMRGTSAPDPVESLPLHEGM
jgi:murein DD-endopeptidase MepM/ murein hydrolase activator NlpD